jgi:hypothetical protein
LPESTRVMQQWYDWMKAVSPRSLFPVMIPGERDGVYSVMVNE